MPDNLPREERDILITLVADVKHLTENQGNFHSEIKAQIADLKEGTIQRINVVETKIQHLEQNKFDKVDFVQFRNETVTSIDTIKSRVLIYTGAIAVLAVIGEAVLQYFLSH